MEDDTSSNAIASRRGILVAAIASIVAAGSYTTLVGLLITDLVDTQGWSVDTIGPGIGINMVLYGVTAPIGVYAMQRYGIARIANLALSLLVGGSVLALFPNPLVFNVCWGLVIGTGTGCLTMAYGSLIVKTWFPDRQGTLSGILVASCVVGQFALLPVWSEVMDAFGWRAPLIGSAALASVAIAANLVFLPDRSGPEPTAHSAYVPLHKGLYASVFRSLLAAFRSRVFWILVALFAICGATTNGIMWSHFTMAAASCGLAVTTASLVLLLVGIFNVVGTTASGWLTDRISLRIILAAAFLLRGMTLLWLPLVLDGVLDSRIVTFGIIFGIMDVATVPPVIAICNRVYGDNGPLVFGWVTAFHQLGAGMMAYAGGMIWLAFGDYDPLWYIAGTLSVVASVLVFGSRYRERFDLSTTRFSARTTARIST